MYLRRMLLQVPQEGAIEHGKEAQPSPSSDHRLCQMWQEVELNRLLVIILAKPISFVRKKAAPKDEAQEQIQEVAFLL